MKNPLSKIIENPVYYIITLLLCSHMSDAQPRQVPAAYSPAAPVSYIRTWDAVKPTADPGSLTTSAAPAEALMTTRYFDGLGRPVQTVVKQGSLISGGSAADIISTTLYDDLGRVSYQYIPAPANAAGGNTHINDGLFKLNPFEQQEAFYDNGNPANPVKGQGETYFYGYTEYEASPLNRVEEVFAPGNSWMGTSGQSAEAARKSVKTKYHINTATDGVRIWNVTNATAMGDFGSYSSPGSYPAGELYKTITVDEEGRQVIEFKDKEGQIVLKKVQLTATADDGTGSSHTGWLCTYYIYDDLNRLRCVIQPRGVELIAANWVLTNATILAEQCFRYEYDQRGRLIVKKVPGSEAVETVYDYRNRPVFSRDGNQRATHTWLVVYYDNLNRETRTGIYTNTSATRASLQDDMDDPAGEGCTPSTVPAPDDLIITSRSGNEPEEYIARNSITFMPGFEAPAGDEFVASIDPNAVIEDPGCETESPPENPVPPIDENAVVFLTYTYYDDYSWTVPAGSPITNTTYEADWNSYLLAASTTVYPYPVANAKSDMTRSMITGSKIKILGTSTYLYTMLIYDDKGRVIQAKSTNATGGTDVITTQYGWQGLPLITVQKQQKSGSNAQVVTTVTKNSYDDLGRIIKTEKKQAHSQYNSGAMSAYATISETEYDALGQVKQKKLGTGPVETLSYDYNIRGWLLGANRDFAKSKSSQTNYFGFDLGYDKTSVKSGSTTIGSYTKAAFNGNIGGMVWKSRGDDEIRKYDFDYDPVNRITAADFNQYTGSSFSKTAGVDFSMTGMGYDANGNILTMNQKGLKINTSPQIDQLTYSYQSNSNKLSKVVDAANDNTNTLGDFKYDPATKGATDYTYDANGNLTADANKKITGISYNHLNLPQVITVTGKGTITYTYDAAGNKLKKVTVDNTATPAKTTTTLYLGGTVYENDELQFIAHEEGRIRPIRDANNNITSFAYDYFLKDHLGNVRMVLTEEEKQDMYPPASMETAQASVEEALYDNISETRVVKPAGYPTDNYTNPNDKVAKVDGNGNKIGPSIILKVMAGDSYNLRASSWYKANGASPASPNSMAVDLIASFFSSLAGIPGYTHGSAALTELQNSGVVPTALNSFLGSQPAPGSTKPKAYLNWVLLDEQFKFVEGSSGADQVGNDNTLTIHTKNNLPITKNGYLYVFVSNETPNMDVYFDNLQITHARGSILEETHYYPFGLTMAGISSKALQFGGAENRYKYNGKELQSKEFSDNSGLELYDFGARMQDPQLGRWWIVDPLAELYPSVSPYAYGLNNPVFWTDPTGMTVEPGSQKEWDKQKQNVVSERDKLQGKIDGLNAKATAKGWSAEKLAGKIGNMQERVNSLDGTIGNLGTLEASDQVYALKSGAGEEGGTTYDPSTGNIVFSYGSTANFVHETIHGGQFESGDIAFDTKTGMSYGNDVFDEVAAYKAQFGYSPSSVSGLTSSSTAKSFGGITTSWVQGITKSDGSKIYAPGGSANTGISPVNMSTNRDGLIKAYPHQKSTLSTVPASTTLKDIPTIYYKK